MLEEVSHSTTTVIHSLMPKGVEHQTSVCRISVEISVIHSLMPKGVEHRGQRVQRAAGHE